MIRKKREKIYLTDNLLYLLKVNRLSVLELADKLDGVSYETIGRIKRDDNCNPTLKTLVSLSNYFDVDIGDLLLKDLSKNVPDTTLIEPIDKGNRIPIAEWGDINNYMNSKKFINVDILSESSLFALYVEKDMGDISKDSYIIINPKIAPKDNDYALIQNNESKNVFVRRIIKERVIYLESLLLDKNIIEYNPLENEIIGVIIGYQKLKLFS